MDSMGRKGKLPYLVKKHSSYYYVRRFPGHTNAKWLNLETLDPDLAYSRYIVVHKFAENKLKEYSFENVTDKINDNYNKITFSELLEKYIDNTEIVKEASTSRNLARMADEILKHKGFGGSAIFSNDEFFEKCTVKNLCVKIFYEYPKLKLKIKKNTISWLNSLLKKPDLFKVFFENRDTLFLPDEMRNLLKDVCKLQKRNTKLNFAEINIIKRFNRLAIEFLYPNDSPKAVFEKVYANKITQKMIDDLYREGIETPFEATKRFKFLHRLFEVAKDWNFVSENPAKLYATTKKYKVTIQAQLLLTPEILFNYIYPNSEPMLQRAIMLGFFLMQHENEVKNLMWNRPDKMQKGKIYNYIDRKTNTVFIERSKTDANNKGLFSPISYSDNPVFCRYINNIFSERKNLCPYVINHSSKNGPVPYSSFKSMWHRALKKAEKTLQEELNDNDYKLPRFKFKELRHLANTCVKDSGIEASRRKAVTLHASTQSNENYTHPSQKDSRDVLKALSIYGPIELLKTDEKESHNVL